MATVTPGTGGTFKSVTAEGQALEALLYLQSRENTELANPTGEDRIQASLDTDLLTLTGQYRLPATQTLNSSGQLVIVAGSYISGGAFQPGSDGTFKSATIEAYCLEVLSYLQGLELQPAKNPNNRNYVTGTYNADTQTYSGSFNLPVTFALSDTGAITFSTVPYLLD